MAGLGPFETWRVPEINTLPDAKKSLVELQRILENMQFQLEQGPGSTGSDAESIQGNPVEPGLPAAGDVYRWDGSQFALWSPKYIQATRGSNQTTNIANGDRVRFNVTGADSGHIALDTTTNVGVFSLTPGVYHLTATCNANFSAAGGSVQFRWATVGGTVFGVSPSAVRPYTSTLNIGRPHVTEAIRVVGGATPADVELRILSPTSLDAVELNIAAAITALA